MTNRSSVRRSPLALCAFVLLAAALAACGSSSTKSASTTSAAAGSTATGSSSAPVSPGPDKITFGLTGGPVAYEVSHFVATDAGYISSAASKFGSTVATQNFDSGPPLLAALAAGSVNFILLGAENVYGLNLKGQGLVGLTTVVNGGQTLLVGAKKYEASRGTDVSKYDGARWGFSSAGSQGAAEAQIIAQNAGLTWSKQQGIALGGIPAYLPALQAGKVDIIDMDPTSAAEAVASGVGYVINNTQAQSTQWPYQDSGLTLIAKKSFVEKYPDLTKAIVAAEIKGSDAVKAKVGDPAAVLAMTDDAFKAANSKNWTIEWGFMSPAFENLSTAFTASGRNSAEAFARVQFVVPTSTTIDQSALTNDYQTS